MKPGIGDVEDISGKHSSELFVRVRTGAVLAVMGFIVLCLSHIHISGGFLFACASGAPSIVLRIPRPPLMVDLAVLYLAPESVFDAMCKEGVVPSEREMAPLTA